MTKDIDVGKKVEELERRIDRVKQSGHERFSIEIPELSVLCAELKKARDRCAEMERQRDEAESFKFNALHANDVERELFRETKANLEQAEAAVSTLVEALKRCNELLYQHHEIGNARRFNETGTCSVCRDSGIFAEIEKALNSPAVQAVKEKK